MNATPPLTPQAIRPLAPSWWLAPAVLSVAALPAGVWGYRSSPIVAATAWLALPYAVPPALTSASWRLSSRADARARGLVLGGIGAFTALVCAHLTTFLLYAVCFVLWGFQGG
ncbi:hypothetical protein [Streptomyces sp. NPDC058279]|uniref:hypothetical protein n=1 Tax=Streptomyces sp. NPDC058279 TaxID=3346418 RepID=UPI0036F1773D